MGIVNSRFTKHENITGASLALFAAAVNTAITAGKVPVSCVHYIVGTTTFSCIFATPKNGKQYPKFTSGTAFLDQPADVATALEAAIAKNPVVLASESVIASDEIVVIVGYQNA